MPIFLSLAKNNPTAFILIVVTLVFSISLHEYFHARCALWMGDSTAADAGHLTLNPFRQMGWISLVMLLVAGIAWGAVPVDPVRLRSRHSWGPLATALAGPAANLLLAVVAWCLFGFLAALVPVARAPADPRADRARANSTPSCRFPLWLLWGSWWRDLPRWTLPFASLQPG